MSGAARRDPVRRRAWVRTAWAAPNSLLGWMVVGLGVFGGVAVRRVGDTWEAAGPGIERLLRWTTFPIGGAEALTLGHVIVGRDRACLASCREHERVHVRQYERWGPVFIPAYLLASCWAFIVGRDPYRDNVFEREAYERADVHSHVD